MPLNRGDERHTIEELVTRYDLHPQLGDIYVEGLTGQVVIEWFLDQYERGDWRVYPIDTVDIPWALVHARGLDAGERGEVLTLGMELSERLASSDGQRVICIADSDTLALDGSRIECDLCLLTDFTSMELYAFTPKALEKFLRLFARVSVLSAADLIKFVSSALVSLFIVRTVFHLARHGIPVLEEFTGCCTKASGEVELDVDALVTRSLQSTSPAHRPSVEAIRREIASLGGKIPADIRSAIRGHDFVRLLAWFLDGYGVAIEFRQVDVIRRALFLSLEANDLAEYPMFAELLSRTAV